MIWSDRDVYVAGHVTQEVKDALRAFAARENKSMSAVIFEAIKEKLAKEGVDLPTPKPSADEAPLPFETVPEPVH